VDVAIDPLPALGGMPDRMRSLVDCSIPVPSVDGGMPDAPVLVAMDPLPVEVGIVSRGVLVFMLDAVDVGSADTHRASTRTPTQVVPESAAVVRGVWVLCGVEAGSCASANPRQTGKLSVQASFFICTSVHKGCNPFADLQHLSFQSRVTNVTRDKNSCTAIYTRKNGGVAERAQPP
jgi:hypothetical protein